MSIYARNDLAYVSISEAHGGCGKPHSRPVENGAPAKLWSLNCPQCEDHLRSDPLWSTTISDLPETFDEALARKDFEKRGAMDERRIMMIALAKLANVELPDTIALALTGVKPHVPGAEMLCPSGHANAPGQKFCGECGASMHGAPPERQIAPPAPSQAPSAPSEDLASLHPQKLAKKCRDAGLNDKGSKAELVARLQAHARQAAGGGQ